MSDLDMVFAVIQSGISVQLVHYISLLVQRVNNRYGILEKKANIKAIHQMKPTVTFW